MGKVLCFGEILLRMSPSANSDWLKKSSMPAYVGGSELNVAVALGKWNIPVAYCTAMPDNYFSNDIVHELKRKNIDINSIYFSGNRIGIYFLAQGTDLKHAAVIYDRDYSSFSALKPGVLDWDKILSDVSWFHFSAISPALNKNIAAVCKEALQAATKKNITISVDLNHRSKLWQYGKMPVDVMPELVQYCDVVMGNIWSANTLLGIHLDEDIHQQGEKTDYLEHAKRTSIAIQRQFLKCKTVANTFRFDYKRNGILYYASLFNNGCQYDSAEFITNKIIEKSGSGDCFMAGLIYGLYHKNDLLHVTNFAAAAAFGKLQEKGDSTNQDVEAIRAALKRTNK
jgi:2-dehydro-3-deoxygluconokinase